MNEFKRGNERTLVSGKGMSFTNCRSKNFTNRDYGCMVETGLFFTFVFILCVRF